MPKVEFALFTTLFICSLNHNSLSTHMPRYFSTVVSSNPICPSSDIMWLCLSFFLPRCIHFHLLALKSSCQSLDHFFKLSRPLMSSCSCFISLWSLISLYSFISSANNFLTDFTQSSRSFIKIMNSSGPRILPCGIPLVTELCPVGWRLVN